MNGNALKTLREEHGYSRSELAEILYVTASMIQSWEEGWAIINPSKGEIREMAEAFNMSVDELREVLDADPDDDYGEDTKVTLLDYIDAGVRAYNFCMDNIKNKNKG